MPRHTGRSSAAVASPLPLPSLRCSLCSAPPLPPPPPHLPHPRVLSLEDVYLKDLDMGELVEMSRAAVVGLASSILKEDPGADLRYLVLDLPCSFFMLRSLSSLRAVTEVARSLRFARPLVELADRIVDGMTLGGQVRARRAADWRAGAAPGCWLLALPLPPQSEAPTLLATQLRYNGVHLRIEKDARDWAMIMGGQQVQA